MDAGANVDESGVDMDWERLRLLLPPPEPAPEPDPNEDEGGARDDEPPTAGCWPGDESPRDRGVEPFEP